MEETCDDTHPGTAAGRDTRRRISAGAFGSPASNGDGRGKGLAYTAAAFEEAALTDVGFVAGSFLVFTFCARENNSIDAAGQKIARLFKIEVRQKHSPQYIAVFKKFFYN
jgi:hypothetical protein